VSCSFKNPRNRKAVPGTTPFCCKPGHTCAQLFYNESCIYCCTSVYLFCCDIKFHLFPYNYGLLINFEPI
jgi:hypothetical protein